MGDERLIERGRSLLAGVGDVAHVLCDATGRVVWVNDAARLLLGRDLTDVLSLSVEDQWASFPLTLMDPSELRDQIARGETVVFEGPIDVGARLVHVRATMHPIVEGGQAVGAAWLLEDRSEALSLRHVLRTRDELSRVLEEVADAARGDGGGAAAIDVLLQAVHDGHVASHVGYLRVDLGALRMERGFGWAEVPQMISVDELDAPWLRAVVAGSDLTLIADAFDVLSTPMGRVFDEARIRSAIAARIRCDGEVVGLLVAADRRPGAFAPSHRRLLDIAADLISAALERQRVRDHRRAVLMTNTATGLPSRRHAEQVLAAQLRDGLSTSVAMIRLRSLDQMITAYGEHLAAPLVSAAGAVLAEGLPAMVAHTDADELLVIADEIVSPGQLGEWCLTLLELPVSLSGGLKASTDPVVGVSVAEPGSTPSVVIGNARKAMIAATKGSESSVEHYRPGLITDSAAELRRAIAVDRCVRERRLHLAVQGGQQLSPGAPRWAEVLVRFEDPELVGVDVGSLVAVAERTGAVHDLGRQVMEMSVRALQRLREDGIELDLLSVNVSPHQMTDPRLMGELERIVLDAGESPSSFALEVTESIIDMDQATIAAALSVARTAGFTLMIDDFGQGQSSLRRVLDLPIDAVKLDRSLLESAMGDARRRTILESIVDLVHALGLWVVVEGIETIAQADLVASLGAEVAQGWLYGRAVPMTDLTVPAWMPSESLSP